MAEYISDYTGEEIDAGISKASTAVQPEDLNVYQRKIDSNNKLSADLLLDGNINKVVSAIEKNSWSNKQEPLISGVNIKTINDNSILGEGNIEIHGGSNIAVKELDFTNPADFNQETGEPTQAAMLDVIANKYVFIHIYNIPVNEDVNAETYLIANNMANPENENNIRYYFKFDEGDESEGTVPNIEQYMFSIEDGQAQLVVENYNLGGGEESNISVYEFNETDVDQAVLSYIANNKPDLLKITTQDSILQDYCKGQDNEYYCIIDGTLVRLLITETEGSYNLEIYRYDLNYIKMISGANNGTNWTSITIGENTYNIPFEVTEEIVANWGFTKNTGTYLKPSEGIPKTDLDSNVQTSLERADTALQEHQSLDNYYTKDQVDGKVSSVYKYKGTVSIYGDLPDTDLTVGDVYNITTADSIHGIKPGDNVAWTGSAWDVLSGTVDLSDYQTKIDSSHKLSADLVDDTSSTNKFVTAQEKQDWNAKSDFSGDYDDLTNKPTIPSEVTESTVSGWGFTKNTGTYSKPNGGIPENDLSSAVQAKLNSETANVVLDSNLVGKKLSLIGDSITTYQGWLPSGNVTRYPRGAITNVEQTWWKKLLNKTGMVIGQNCAWDGSTCSGLSTSTTNAYAACSDKRISQLGLNGTPDIIICYIGINDWGATYNKNQTQYGGSFVNGAFVPVGNYTGEAALPSGELKTFSEAYGCMIGKIQTSYPNAKIYCCTLPQTNGKATYNYDADGAFPSINRDGVSIADYNDCIRMLANNFGVEVIEFAKCGITWGNITTYMEDGLHPTPDGMTLLADKAAAKLYDDFGVSVHGGSPTPTPTTGYSVTNTLSHVSNSNSATTVSENASYVGTLSAETGYRLQSVTVTMGGTDITATAYNNGTITIQSVTGNLVITASAELIPTYTITNNLTHVVNSNEATSIVENNSYTATLSAESTYNLQTAIITMGGTDITASVYSNGNINIPSVTGNVVITATATAQQSYSITNNLTNVTTSNNTASVVENGSYNATLSAAAHYTLDASSVEITMGGTDITSTAYNNGTISIGNVTGNVVITASAIAITYTITNTLTNVTNSNNNTSIVEGSSYTASLSAESGYAINSVTITMGETDITSTAYSDGTINIPNVTGNLVIIASATLIVTYSITNNLTHATNSNTATTITEGSSYTATITADTYYELDTVTVTMGGTDVTSTVYSNGSINISSVTGNIVITVTTNATTTWHTNFAQTSTSSFVASSRGWALDETTYANAYGKPINKISFVATANSGSMDFCIAPSKNAQTGFTNAQTISWDSSNKSGNIVTIDIPEFTLADGTYLCVYVNTTPASGAACYASGGTAGQFYSYVGSSSHSTWGAKGSYSIQMNLGYKPSSNNE